MQGAINHLHLLNYAERLEWIRLFTIPNSGMLITPDRVSLCETKPLCHNGSKRHPY